MIFPWEDENKVTTEDWEYHKTMLILQRWKLYICWENPGYKPKSRIIGKDSLSRCRNRACVAGDRGREDFFQEFWVTVTKSVLWLWKKDWFCGSNLNLVLMGMERNQTGKDRLWFLVKNLEIREATVHGNAFSDLQNSLTIYWMR